MLFDEHSIQFKITMLTIWIFPYFVLSVITRNWRLWINKLVFSLSSLFMFIASILMITILVADYVNISRMNLSIYDLLLETVLTVSLFFPGLVLVIMLGAFASIVKPDFP